MKRLRLQFFAALCVLSLILIFLDGQGRLGLIRSAAQFVTAPLSAASYSLKNNFSDSVSFLTFWKSGEERIKNLEQKNLELLVSANKEKGLEKENTELRKQLGVGSLSSYKQLPASVLGVSRYMTINVGKKNGVVVGQSVIYLDNFIGQIIRSDQNVSFVQLPTDADLKIPVKVGANGIVRGFTTGQYNSSIFLDQVAQNEELKKDDLIMTTGEGGKFIPDMVVGKVNKIVSSPTDLFQKAEVQPLVNYDKLKTVFVILK